MNPTRQAAPDHEALHTRHHDSSPEKQDSGHSSLDEKRSFESTSSEPAEHLLNEARALEAQPTAPEDLVPRRTKIMFISMYLFLNLALTLSNKSVLSKLRLPWLLTTSHTTATSLGCFVLMGTGHLTLTPLSTQPYLLLLAFSLLFTLNIAISNVSLSMVSVPMHQILRSTCPAVTILIYRTIYKRSYSTPTYLSIIPLVLGAALATAGDYTASTLGLLLTLLGVLLACIKTIATNRLMTGPLNLSAMELLLRLSPLAALQSMAYAYLTGEIASLRNFHQIDHGFTTSFSAAVVVNACMAFALNVVSFQTNKVVGALAVTVCGNVKQVLTILLGIVLFSVPVGFVNAVGMVVTVVGAAWFSKVELDGKRARMVAG